MIRTLWSVWGKAMYLCSKACSCRNPRSDPSPTLIRSGGVVSAAVLKAASCGRVWWGDGGGGRASGKRGVVASCDRLSSSSSAHMLDSTWGGQDHMGHEGEGQRGGEGDQGLTFSDQLDRQINGSAILSAILMCYRPHPPCPLVWELGHTHLSC